MRNLGLFLAGSLAAAGIVASVAARKYAGHAATLPSAAPALDGANKAVPARDATTPPATPAAPPPPTLTQINGQSFPDHVLALTWDDGPDEGSLALAEWLHRRRISATFFVVAAWVRGVSSDPGEGHGVFETGYERIPVLKALVRLGHRLGNHTRNHALLTEIEPAQADLQVRENQQRLDPALTNELRTFRVPGGAWDLGAANAIAADPYLKGLVGPIRWDVDRKDWEGSLYCSSDHPGAECAIISVGSRSEVKPAVVAARYLASIEEAKHGIVLLHDRVGHVGSSYAMDVARALVPELEARGYVFAAPVLAFSPLLVRTTPEWRGGDGGDRTIRFVDVDGDGRADLCSRAACWRSVELPGSDADPLPRTAFRDPLPPPAALPAREPPPAVTASASLGAVDPRTIRAGDLNGDGRADACARGRDGVVCALATRQGFARATLWLRSGMTDADGWAGASDTRAASFQLADVNGDGRADLCADSANGVVCALAP